MAAKITKEVINQIAEKVQVKIQPDIKLEIERELESNKSRLDSDSIEFIANEVEKKINAIEQIRVDNQKFIEQLAKQYSISEAEKKLSFNREKVFTPEVRKDFISDIVKEIPVPKDGVDGLKGDKGEKGDTYTLTDNDRLDIAQSVDLKGVVKEDLFNKRMLKLIDDIQKGRIRLPAHGGINGPEIIKKIDKALGSDSWQLPSDTPYNSITWDGNQDAATKNSIRDQIEIMLADIANLENQNELFELFENVSSTSGTITKPTDSTILLNRYESAADAIVVKTDSNGRPIDEPPKTAAGATVTVTSFSVDGDYTLSGIPSEYPVSIIYQISIARVNSGNVTQDQIVNKFETYDADEVGVDTSSFSGSVLSSTDTEVQTALNTIDNGFAEIHNTTAQTVWVDPDTGSDVTGTVGDINRRFATGQAAIDAVTDASPSKRYWVLFSPGEHTGTLNCKNYVNLGCETGSSEPVTISSTTGPILNLPSSSIVVANLKFILQPAANNQVCVSNTNTTGLTKLYDCDFQVLYGGDLSGIKVLDIDQSTFLAFRSSFVQILFGATTHTNDIIVCDIKGETNVELKNCNGGANAFKPGSYNVTYFNHNSDGIFTGTTVLWQILTLSATYTGNSTALSFKKATTAPLITAGSIILMQGGDNAGSAGTAIQVDSSSGAALATVNASSVEIVLHGSKYAGQTKYADNSINFNFCSISTGLIFDDAVGTIKRNYVQDNAFITNEEIIDEGMLLNDPTNKSLQDLFNIGFSAGWVSGAEITDNLNGTINIAGGTGVIRITNNEQAPLRLFDFVGRTNIPLVDGKVNMTYIDYNAGNPQIEVTDTNIKDIINNKNDKFDMWAIVREGTDLDIMDHRNRALNVPGRLQLFLHSKFRLNRADADGGLILGETGTRNVTATAGLMWQQLQPITINAIDTSAADTFDRYYTTDSGVTWVKTTGNTQWDNLQYNDPTTGLVSMNTGRYSYQDFYISSDGELVSIYGQAQYTLLSSAQDAPIVANPPVRVDKHTLLIGRIVFQQSDTTAQTILSSFAAVFQSAPITDHGALSGLPDDDHLQYALLAGRSGGQSLYGGTDASNNLILESTSNATKGHLILQPAGGFVGLNTNSPDSAIDIEGESQSAATIMSRRFGNSAANASYLELRRARGTQSSPAAIQNGDLIGRHWWRGYDGTSWNASAEISAEASENWSGTDNGTDILFRTTANGASSLTEIMRIANSGNIGFGNVATPKANFQMSDAGSIFLIGSDATQSIWFGRNAYTDDDGVTFKRLIADNDVSIAGFNVDGSIGFYSNSDSNTGVDSVITPKLVMNITKDNGVNFSQNPSLVELTNNSGGALAKGAVVIVDTANDLSVTTTTTASHESVVGAIEIGASNGQTVGIASGGIITVNVTGATNRGDFLATSTSAGSAVSTGTTGATGDFAIALTSTAGAGQVKAIFKKTEVF